MTLWTGRQRISRMRDKPMRLSVLLLLLSLLTACSQEVELTTLTPTPPPVTGTTTPPPPETPIPPSPTDTPVPTQASATAFPDAASYDWTPVAEGLVRPVDIQNAGDGSGRLFIIEQSG